MSCQRAFLFNSICLASAEAGTEAFFLVANCSLHGPPRQHAAGYYAVERKCTSSRIHLISRRAAGAKWSWVMRRAARNCGINQRRHNRRELCQHAFWPPAVCNKQTHLHLLKRNAARLARIHLLLAHSHSHALLYFHAVTAHAFTPCNAAPQPARALFFLRTQLIYGEHNHFNSSFWFMPMHNSHQQACCSSMSLCMHAALLAHFALRSGRPCESRHNFSFFH